MYSNTENRYLKFLRPESIEAFNDLIETIKNRKCISFVGNGISMDVGYPSWDLLVGQMAKKSNIDIPPEQKEDYNTFTTTLQKCKDHLNEQYYEMMRNIFEEDKKKPYSEMHRLLLELPFISHFTTNVDNCHINALERVIGIAKNNEVFNNNYYVYPTFEIEGLLQGRTLYYLHGKLDINNCLIFSKSEYAEAYYPGSGLSTFLTYCFMHYDCVFFGYSFGDPSINEIIKIANNSLAKENEIRKAQKRDPLPVKKQFVFLLSEEPSTLSINTSSGANNLIEEIATLKNENIFTKLGIKPIYYSKHTEYEHLGLVYLINYLHSQIVGKNEIQLQPK